MDERKRKKRRRRQVEARCFSRFEFIYSFASLIIISMNLVNFTKLSYFITIIQPNNKNKALHSKRIEKKQADRVFYIHVIIITTILFTNFKWPAL